MTRGGWRLVPEVSGGTSPSLGRQRLASSFHLPCKPPDSPFSNQRVPLTHGFPPPTGECPRVPFKVLPGKRTKLTLLQLYLSWPLCLKRPFHLPSCPTNSCSFFSSSEPVFNDASSGKLPLMKPSPLLTSMPCPTMTFGKLPPCPSLVSLVSLLQRGACVPLSSGLCLGVSVRLPVALRPGTPERAGPHLLHSSAPWPMSQLHQPGLVE